MLRVPVPGIGGSLLGRSWTGLSQNGGMLQSTIGLHPETRRNRYMFSVFSLRTFQLYFARA
jgi:hypothetical protein